MKKVIPSLSKNLLKRSKTHFKKFSTLNLKRFNSTTILKANKHWNKLFLLVPIAIGAGVSIKSISKQEEEPQQTNESQVVAVPNKKPLSVSKSYQYSSLGSRILACLIDFLVLLPFTGGSIYAQFSSNQVLKYVLLGLNVAVNFTKDLFSAGMTRSIGKSAMGLKIVDSKTGEQASVTQILLRKVYYLPGNLLSLVPSSNTQQQVLNFGGEQPSFSFGSAGVGGLTGLSLTLFGLVDFFTILLSEGNRSLGDFIFGTVVVKDDE